jgi:hypothetical protein
MARRPNSTYGLMGHLGRWVCGLLMIAALHLSALTVDLDQATHIRSQPVALLATAHRVTLAKAEWPSGDTTALIPPLPTTPLPPSSRSTALRAPAVLWAPVSPFDGWQARAPPSSAEQHAT